MFRLLCKLKSQTHKKGLSDSPIHHLYYSSLKNENQPLTIEDIRKACKSPHNLFQRESEQNPNKVLKFFQDYGFTQTQVQSVVSKYPQVLFIKIDKNLKPKIDFFASIGLSESEVADAVTSSPFILKRSLKFHIAPSIDFLRTALGGDENMVTAFKLHPSIVYYNLTENMKNNILTLRNVGVPEDHIMKLSIGMRRRNVVANSMPDRFREVVSDVLELGFPSSSTPFLHAVSAMAGYSEATWARKLMFFRSLGFSDDEFTYMFRKRPDLMLITRDNIKAVVEFYVDKFRWRPSQISNYPIVLMFSLHNRIIPRCLVLLVLAARNMITKRVKLSSVLKMNDNLFSKRYVTEYRDKIPQVLDAYQGMAESKEVDIDREKLSQAIIIP